MQSETQNFMSANQEIWNKMKMELIRNKQKMKQDNPYKGHAKNETK